MYLSESLKLHDRGNAGLSLPLTGEVVELLREWLAVPLLAKALDFVGDWLGDPTVNSAIFS